MSDIQYPAMTKPQGSETLEYERKVIEILDDVQGDFLAIKSFSKQLLEETKNIKTLAQQLFGKGGKEVKGLGADEKEKKFSGSLTLNKILPRDPGSAFLHKTMWNIQDENEKKSSGLWKLLGGGLLGGGLIAGAIGVLLSGLFDDGPFKGTKKLVGKVMLELGQGIMKRVIKPFKGLLDNVFKVFGDKILKPFKGFTDKIWKMLSGIGDVLLKPFRAVFDNIIKFFGGLGGKLFKGMGKGMLGKAFSRVAKFVGSKMSKLAKALKFAPGIGSIVGLGFSISRFVNGDIVGGILELVAAIADAVPGIGTAISWGLDILLAARDLGAFKEGGVIKGKLDVKGFFGKIWTWVKEKASALGNILAESGPIKFIVDFAKKIGEGDIGGALESLAFLSAPVGWLLSLITGTPKGEEVKKKTAQALKGGGDMIKQIAGEVGKLASSLFDFISDAIMTIIEKAGSMVSIGTEWVDDKILSPVMGWIGDKISQAVATVENIKQWVEDNITSPVKGFFTSIPGKVKAIYEKVSGWVKDNITNPVAGFFDSLWTAITDAKDGVVDWVKEKLIWPLRDFFSTIGSFFGTFKDMGLKDIWNIVRGNSEDVFGERKDEQRESKIREIGKENISGDVFRYIQGDIDKIKEQLRKQGEWFPGITDVNDAIIKPGGQVIKTAPDDTIIATKNNVDRQSDREINATVDQMNRYDDTQIQRQNNAMIRLLEKIADKNFEQTNVNTVQTTEDKISPRQLTRMMTAEVY